MGDSTIVVGISVLYLGACLLVGMWPRKQSASADGYVAGDRSLGLVVMYFITGATIFSAFAFLGAPGRAYEKGAYAFYILSFGTLGFVPFYFIGPRAARLGRRFGFVTQAEMVASRFRMPALAGAMALVSALAFVPYLTLQMQGSGYVLNAVTRDAVPRWMGGLIVYAVVLAYVWRSGVLGVGWTNTFQGMFMLALAWGLGLYLPYKLYGGVGPMFARLAVEKPEYLVPPGPTSSGEPGSWGAYSTDILVSIIGFSFWPHLFMKAFTARDENTLRRTVVLYPTFQFFLVPLVIIGFAGILFASAPEQPDQILPHILMNVELSPVLVGLFCAGALAASMSSGDAIAHAAGSILIRDGVVTALGKRFDPARERFLIRVTLTGVMVLAYVIALLGADDLVALLLYAYGPITQFAPVVVAALYWRRATGTGVFAGLVAGVVISSILKAEPAWRPWPLHEGIYGMVANVAILVFVSLATQRQSDWDREYLEVAAGGGGGLSAAPSAPPSASRPRA